jgi:hypothetical protein
MGGVADDEIGKVLDFFVTIIQELDLLALVVAVESWCRSEQTTGSWPSQTMKL